VAITLVLADDHPIFLYGLEEMLTRETGFRVLERCPDGKATLQAVWKHKPDILTLKLRMPKMDGLEVLRQMQKKDLST